MNDKNLYSAVMRNAESLSGKNVSHTAAKKVSFQSPFKSWQGVRDDDIVHEVQHKKNSKNLNKKKTARE